MGFHDLLGHFRGGDDQGRGAKEMEKHQRPMFVGEKAERTVWERAQLMEISDNGKLWGRWGLVGLLGSCCIEEEKES